MAKVKLPDVLGPHPLASRFGSAAAHFYEVWFGELALDDTHAFWFHCQLTKGLAVEASALAVVFDRNRQTVLVKQEFPVSDLALAAGSWKVPGFEIDDRSTRGAANAMSWDLQFQDLGRRFEHVPLLLRRLKIAKATLSSPLLDLIFSGEVRFGSTGFSVSRQKGMIGHIFGQHSARRWAWGHCNDFAGDSEVVFEGLSAAIGLAGVETTPLTSLVLWVGQECHRFSSVIRLFSNRSHFGSDTWTFAARNGATTLEGQAQLPAPDQVAAVSYTDTDGSTLTCRNSRLSTLRLTLSTPEGTRHFEAQGTAAFEIVTRP